MSRKSSCRRDLAAAGFRHLWPPLVRGSDRKIGAVKPPFRKVDPLGAVLWWKLTTGDAPPDGSSATRLRRNGDHGDTE
jgi:hypothetical protein